MSASAPTRTRAGLSGHEPASYRPHRLHGEGPSYPETNCYADLLIELLHACGYEPLAMLGHVLRVDFEGDQWTFFKPPPQDLEALFGIDIHEMQPYRPLPVQMAEQIERGRTIIVELDSFYLPDTAATSYGREHVKSSVAAEAVDPEAETLRYFHGAGLYELCGDDFRGVFRHGEFSSDVLPPYTELVRFDAGPALEGGALRQAAAGLLRHHLARRPDGNPFERFGVHLEERLPELLSGSLEEYHAYVFATTRMAGAAFELAGSHIEWLLGRDGERAVVAMTEIVDACKAISFRLARRRPFDPAPLLATMAQGYENAITALRTRVD